MSDWTVDLTEFPIGLKFDGSADDVKLLRSAGQEVFLQRWEAYQKIVDEIEQGTMSLYKVQVFETQMKQVFVPTTEGEGGAAFAVEKLYQQEAPLEIPRIGFEWRKRTTTKISKA